MYTIKRVAELTGVGLSTLRAWERRYGVVTPQRSDGHYRLYTDADVRTIAIMAALVHDGWSAGEAAAETLQRVTGSVEHLEHLESGADPAGADGAGTEALGELIRAADNLQAPEVAALLDRGLASGGTFEEVANRWLMPTLIGVGEAWADGRLSVAGEHLVSYAVQRRLAAFYESASGRGAGPLVVFGLPPGARHELGILTFAVAARRAGVSTAYVGADLPGDTWESAVQTRRAAAVVMAVPRLADVVAAQGVVDRLRAGSPDLVIGVGGRHQDDVSGVTHLGHDFAAGAALLQSEVSTAATGGQGSGKSGPSMS
ncbi:transcriptional regulator [Knoellia sinensis KCTC 19936]|uniref:Transcriptional regulator n=1 Tax=Knoellia sinensis KCTC 19936 TaxID=1385520 RepID=A0A0A0J3R1_9MICO|nr:MerR family transcriptional regulator [Knoellia sinensis]KGN31339.1 transcriptional regulator [Knoellia sinensis KCTC 19936]